MQALKKVSCWNVKRIVHKKRDPKTFIKTEPNINTENVFDIQKNILTQQKIAVTCGLNGLWFYVAVIDTQTKGNKR